MNTIVDFPFTKLKESSSSVVYNITVSEFILISVIKSTLDATLFWIFRIGRL